jgi:hypothetical protein
MASAAMLALSFKRMFMKRPSCIGFAGSFPQNARVGTAYAVGRFCMQNKDGKSVLSQRKKIRLQ